MCTLYISVCGFVTLRHTSFDALTHSVIPAFVCSLCVFGSKVWSGQQSHVCTFPCFFVIIAIIGMMDTYEMREAALGFASNDSFCSEHTFAHDDDAMKQWNHRGQSRAQQKELKPQNKYILCLFNCSVSNIVPFYLRLITLTNEKVRKSCTRGRQGEKYDYDYDSDSNRRFQYCGEQSNSAV